MSFAITQRGVETRRCVYIMHDGQSCGVEFKQHIRVQRHCTRHTYSHIQMIGKQRAGVRTNEQGRAEA